MSALRDIKDFVLGKPTTVKVEMPPVAPQATAPPAFLTANLKPDTKEFLVVSGSYNFAVAKSFAQPVVGLTDGWYPEYADMPPFNTAARCEIVISRVPPELTPGATDVQPLLTKAAAQSANLDTNIRVLMSFLRHRWICDRCVLSNAGVFQMAQERFESR